VELQRLIAAMARDNPAWGEERIAAELLLQLGIRVSPRTVRRYMDRERGEGGWHSPATGQCWAAFVRNHAQALVACDFCVVVTATFHILYVFVALEIGSRRLLHINVTRHPTAEWTLQQFREILAEPHGYRFVLHDRDSSYSLGLDAAVTAMGVRVLRTPVQSPMANAYCERLLGTLRRECLDFLIPFGEEHLRRVVRVWQGHYNGARPHSRLGPALRQPPPGVPVAPIIGHELPQHMRVVARPVLGGLHHEYGLERLVA
jgi:transposase InsO family protein